MKGKYREWRGGGEDGGGEWAKYDKPVIFHTFK